MPLCVFTFCTSIVGQNYISKEKSEGFTPKIHRVHLGLKAGTPGIASAGLEVVSPLLRNRIAPFVEFSRINVDYEEATIQNRSLEYGVNLYFSGQGKKGYLAVSRSRLTLNGVEKHPDIVSEVNTSFRGTNVKLGGRWGGQMYFRMEAGFTFGKVPEGLQVIETDTEGNNSSDYEAFPETVNAFTQMGLPVFNIGMGVSL